MPNLTGRLWKTAKRMLGLSEYAVNDQNKYNLVSDAAIHKFIYLILVIIVLYLPGD